MTLYNADTDRPITPMSDGMTIDLSALPAERLSVVATGDSTTRSIQFGLNGNSNYSLESSAPLAITGDDSGDLNAWTPPPGSHTLSLTPFSESKGGGSAGSTKQIRFNVTDEDTSPSPLPAPEQTTTSGPTVTSLTLYNADTGAAITSLTNGQTIDLAALSTRNLNVVATGNSLTGSVKFGLDGNSNYRVENFAPLALAGDGNGKLNSWTPSVGAHTITVTPYSQSNAGGTAGLPLVTQLTVVNGSSTPTPQPAPQPAPAPAPGPVSGPAITSLTLYNADTGAAITSLANGQTIDLATLPTRNLNVVATGNSLTGSVKFGLDRNSNYRVENAAPLALAGDRDGKLNSWIPSVGAHTLTVTPYSQSSAGGTAGLPLVTQFTVVNSSASTTPTPQPPAPGNTSGPAVTGLTLYNADTDRAIGALTNGQTIDLATLPTRNLTVVASGNSATESVKFGLDGNSNYSVESAAPLALAGDSSGNLNSWTPSTGAHTLTVTPYSESKAGGTAGSPLVTQFSVVNGSGSTTEPAPSPTPGSSSGPTPISTSNNRSPSVSLVTPGATTFGGPAYMLLRANASDSDGKVTKVEFYAGNTLIGSSTGAPWMASWRNVQPGTYKVVAKAYDNKGAASISSPMTIKVVNPTGRTIHVKPGQSVNSAVRSASAGDTVLVQPGTYKGTITLRNNGTPEKPITIKAAGAPGSVIIDGGGSSRLLIDEWVGAGKWTTVEGLTFRNANNSPGQNLAAIKTTEGMRLIDVTVHNASGAGIAVFNDHVVLVRVTAHTNGCTGIGGSRFDGGMILDSTSYNNNTKKYSGSFEGGGGKFTRVESLLVEGHHSYNNNGPGIWFDGDNINITIRNSTFHDNNNLQNSDGTERIGGRGIQLEISGIDSDDNGGIADRGPILIENVLTYDNDNASVQVYATANVTLKNNTFINDYIDLKDKRPRPHVVENLTIINNKLKDAHIAADGTVVSNYDDENFVIDGNTYDTDGKLFHWNGKSFSSLSSVRSSLGFEDSGRTGNVSYNRV